MNSVRCLVFGDSMVLPTDELDYEDTWVHKIRNKYARIELIVNALRGGVVSRLNHRDEDGNNSVILELYNPDIIIIQMGLPDASPRLLPRNKWWVKILNLTPIAKYVYKYLRKFRGRQIKYNDTPPNQFQNEIEKFCLRAQNCNTSIIIVKISYTTKATENKSPLINQSITMYNSILDNISSKIRNTYVVEGCNGEDELYQSDGYHLNKFGQQIIYNRIEEKLIKILSSDSQ